MSDFDKEAERERLRERFEKDQKRREATERMSDLLLKGATMTNRHCDQCGNPLFRANGEEFCPYCQEADEEPEQSPNEPEAPDQEQTQTERQVESPRPDTGKIDSGQPGAALLAVVEAHAERARETTDPHRATEHLKAAREAAEVYRLLQEGHSS